MPVLVGTPSLVLVSRVQVYQTCSVDLTWQRAVHACQQCPKAVLGTGTVAPTLGSPSGIKRATSRFCPAGVHMSNCLPATELFTTTGKSTLNRPHSISGSNDNNDVLNSGIANTHLSWGLPNLPLPTLSPNHPVHAAHLARSSYQSDASSTIPVVSIPTTTPITKTTTSVTVHHFYPVQRIKTIDSKTTITPTSTPSITTDTISSQSQTGIVQEDVNDVNKIKTNEIKTDDEESVKSKLISSNILDQTDKSASTTSVHIEYETNGSSEPHLTDGSGATRTRKDESTLVSSKSKVPSVTGNQNVSPTVTTENEIVAPARGTTRIQNHEDDSDKIKTTKNTKIVSDRVGSKQQQQQHANSILSSDTSKSDVTSPTSRQQTTPTVSVREAREPNKHHRSHSAQSQNSTSAVVTGGGGGVGDVGSVASKTVVTSRTDQMQPSSVDSTSVPQNKQSTPIATNIQPPTTALRKALPSFHFPLGSTHMSAEEIATEIDRITQELTKLAESVQSTNRNSDLFIPFSNFGQVAKILNCSFYWKYAIYTTAGGTADRQPISVSNIIKLWSNVLNTCPDDASRFVYLLTRGRANYLVQSDFSPLIQDILESHPGLAFLEAAKDFHSRYVATVVARIFFNVNISWSGKISLGELRRSNFLTILASLEMEEDINLVTQYFSYEHFYVIYCKFWELDEDHDLIISRADLARHNNYAISERMIDRIFSGAVTRGSAFKEGVMTYPDFVWFLLAEEDKRHPRSIEYWFRCMDLDGDGLLSMYELDYFYKEQLARMEEMGIEPISFEDCLCQCLDMVKPVLVDKIRLSDMKQCRLCHIFFDTFFNLPKYLQHEQRDPFANLRDIEEGLNELSDWDRYAAETYEMLVNVEGGNQEDGGDDEDGDDDDDDEDNEDEDGNNVANTTIVLGNKSSKKNGQHKDNYSNITGNKIESVNNDLVKLDSTIGDGELLDVKRIFGSTRGKRRRGISANHIELN